MGNKKIKKTTSSTRLYIHTFFLLFRSGSANMRNRIFDVVIIDEVGQATEPDCWVALSKAKKTILVSFIQTHLYIIGFI